MNFLRLLAATSIVLLVTSCSHWGKDDEDKNPYKDMSAKALHESSQKSLKKKEYATAAKQLEAMESMYPFSDYTEQSQLSLIYAYYENEDYPSAAAAAERFIHLYPRAKDVDYAYYMKALANFQQTRGLYAKLLPLDESWRDPGSQTQAFADFSVFLERFPDSRYKEDALRRIIYLRNMFAQRELNVAQFYFKRKMYVAAVERSSYLVKNYPQAPSAQKALTIMYRANKALGLKDAASDALKVYEATYKTNKMPAV